MYQLYFACLLRNDLLCVEWDVEHNILIYRLVGQQECKYYEKTNTSASILFI